MREMAGLWSRQKEVMVLQELHVLQGRLMEMSDNLQKSIWCVEGNLEGLGMGSGCGPCADQLCGLGKGQLCGPEGRAPVTGQCKRKEKVVGWGKGPQPKGPYVSQLALPGG